MDFSMTGQQKDDLLIEATAWTGLTVFVCLLGYGNIPLVY
jgi:hypothetical protein